MLAFVLRDPGPGANEPAEYFDSPHDQQEVIRFALENGPDLNAQEGDFFIEADGANSLLEIQSLGFPERLRVEAMFASVLVTFWGAAF